MWKGGLLLLVTLFLFGCDDTVEEEEVPDDETPPSLENEPTAIRTLDLISKFAFYDTVPDTLNIAYFNDEALPYVEISEYIYLFNTFRYNIELSYEVIDEKLVITHIGEIDHFDELQTYQMVLDANENTMEATSGLFAKDDRIVHYNNYYNVVEYSRSETEGYSINLSTYNFNIEKYNGNFYLPFHLAQYFLMLDLVHFYYNHDDVYVFHTKKHTDIYESSLNDTEIPEVIIDASYNYMHLLLDQVYGLKFLDDTLNYDAEMNQFKAMIYDNETHYQGIRYLLRNLNDLHSNLYFNGHYTKTRTDTTDFPNYINESRWDDYLDANNSRLYNYCNNQQEVFTPLSDNVGHLMIKSFHSNSAENMAEWMNTANEYEEIDTIILDLSCNNGGSSQGAIETLSFLTNETIHINRIHTIDETLIELVIESKHQNKEYEWYIMVSPLTYSMANMFAGIAQDNDLATLMGIQTAGGASYKYLSSTPSGALFSYSAPHHFVSQDLESFEFGSTIDISMQYSQYNINFLLHLID